MVLLVLTRVGWNEVEALVARGEAAVWIDHDVLTAAELAVLRQGGANLASFSHPLKTNDPEWLAGVLATIAEHHPGQRVWVEMSGEDG